MIEQGGALGDRLDRQTAQLEASIDESARRIVASMATQGTGVQVGFEIASRPRSTGSAAEASAINDRSRP